MNEELTLRKGFPVELVDLSDAGEMVIAVQETILLYNRQGNLCLYFSRQTDLLLPESHFIIVPAGERIRLRAKGDSVFLVWKVNEFVLFNEYVMTGRATEEEAATALFAHKHIRDMLDLFVEVIRESVVPGDYIEGKLAELLILMRWLYSKELLTRFFQPLEAIDHAFKKKVLLHYSGARTVEELASLVNLSRTGFHQYFKKTLGKTPSRWMREEKARRIYRELTATTKPIKQIWQEQGFSSASYFNQFCRRQFGEIPSKIKRRRYGE